MVGSPHISGYDVAEKFLGKPEVMAALRDANPEVAGRLEQLVGTGLTNLSLVTAHFIPDGDGTILNYVGTAATQEFYSDPITALRKAGVIPADADDLMVERIAGGKLTERKDLEARFNGFELYIKIFHPGYQASQA